MKKTEKNNFDNVFSYTFDRNFLLVGSQYSIDKINLKEFLFLLHESLFMKECLTVNKLKQRNNLLRKSFEIYSETQKNILKKNPSKRKILEACADNNLCQIPLSPKERLFGFFIKSCFHIVAYDKDHKVLPTKK